MVSLLKTSLASESPLVCVEGTKLAMSDILEDSNELCKSRLWHGFVCFIIDVDAEDVQFSFFKHYVNEYNQ